ncbi:MAG TPA: FAD-dependent oxidoreductase [Gemmatimonadaceae bacterium]|nr:FAD-dependent oxidoreductase [Gemmatimonadaceae bacterium]
MADTADIVVVGAGMAGIAAAYHLAARRAARNVVLIDEREPLTLTSDKGTQAYRNWWPGPDATMLRYMTRSIDLLEEMADESGNAFRLNRRGYVFVTADEEGVDRLRATAREVSSFGMGELREHGSASTSYQPPPPEGYDGQPEGADLLDGSAACSAFPGLTADTRAALHVRRAGWFNAIALGAWMLKRALGAGVTFVRDRVTSIDTRGGRVRGVGLASGATIECARAAIAAGPALPDVLRTLDLELPLFQELHAKLTLRDTRGVVNRATPFLIWNDPVELPWTEQERAKLRAEPNGSRLLLPFPGGVHLRPVDGPHGDELYIIWTYDVEPRPFAWPPRFDRHYGEIAIRGLARMLPAMKAYFGHGDRGFVDGGYYCKTRENRPLVGPLPVEGAYVLGALSGYGIMGSHAGADLLAAHLMGARLPEYASWFLPSRYDDAGYRAEIDRWGANVGQL